MSNWGLSHKGLGIRSVAEVAMLYLCMRAFQLLQKEGGETETDSERENEREKEEFWALHEALAKTDGQHYPLGKIQL